MVEPSESEPSLHQTPHQLNPFSQHDAPNPPKKFTPQPIASQVARNLEPLFQPTPRKSQLLQMNHPALRSLPDEIQYEIRKKIKKEEDIVQKSPQWKIVTERKIFLEAAQHKCIMDVTEAHGYRFDPNQKCPPPPLSHDSLCTHFPYNPRSPTNPDPQCGYFCIL